METNPIPLTDPLSLEEMEHRFSKAMTGLLGFFEFDCCIDTIPPIPPGTPGTP